MSLGKKDIKNNISSKANLSKDTSNTFLHKFISLIKDNSKNKIVKISNFGSFYYKDTPERLGRNPKTKVEFIISKRTKLNFNTSNKIKNFLN